MIKSCKKNDKVPDLFLACPFSLPGEIDKKRNPLREAIRKLSLLLAQCSYHYYPGHAMQILANFNFNRVRRNTGTKFEINLFHLIC